MSPPNSLILFKKISMKCSKTEERGRVNLIGAEKEEKRKRGQEVEYQKGKCGDEKYKKKMILHRGKEKVYNR